MVSDPVVSVNGIFSVTVTFPSMVISSKPTGSIPPLQFAVLDQSPVAPPTQTTIETQASTAGVPVIGLPVITPLQSLFIVPLLLLMPMPAIFDIVMVPELLMMPPLLLKMPLPSVFDIVMSRRYLIL